MKPRFAHKIIKPKGDWVSAAATDVAKTFERERNRLKAEREFTTHKITSILRKAAHG